MNKRIAYQDSEGHLCIVTPAPEMFDKASRTRQALSLSGVDFKNDGEIMSYICNKDVPKNITYTIMEKDQIPADRAFRDAWEFSTDQKQIQVNVGRAKEIHLNKFRVLRKSKLKQLDIEYQRADEENDRNKKRDVVIRKQYLRDITDQSLPNDLEELKNFIPKCLR